jgi:hypothetical protein
MNSIPYEELESRRTKGKYGYLTDPHDQILLLRMHSKKKKKKDRRSYASSTLTDRSSHLACKPLPTGKKGNKKKSKENQTNNGGG